MVEQWGSYLKDCIVVVVIVGHFPMGCNDQWKRDVAFEDGLVP